MNFLQHYCQSILLLEHSNTATTLQPWEAKDSSIIPSDSAFFHLKTTCFNTKPVRAKGAILKDNWPKKSRTKNILGIIGSSMLELNPLQGLKLKNTYSI